MMDAEHSREIAGMELFARLKKAEAEATPLREAELRDEAENEVLNQFIHGDLSLADYHLQDPRKEMIYPGEVFVSNPEELFEALKMLTGNDRVAREFTDHEADHYNEAVRLGFPPPRFMIRFLTIMEKVILMRLFLL